MIVNKLLNLYRKYFWSLERQARFAGVVMGSNNLIRSRFWGSAEGYLITIGSNCGLTAGTQLFTHGGGHAARSKYPNFDCFGKVTLGNYVYVGTNALIMPGVSIGDNVLIAAASVVTKSVPSNVVVAGNPAKIVCTIDEYISNNLPYNLNSKGLSLAEKKRLLENIPEEKFIRQKMMYAK